MRTTEPITSTASGPTRLGDAALEVVTLANTVFVAGPPVLATLAVAVLCGLMLAGPFLLIVTLVVVFAAAVGVVMLAGALLATPYLLVRHARRRLAARRAVAVSPADQAAPRPAIALLAGSMPAGASQ